MVTIGVDQYFSNSDLYGHRCLEKIKMFYKYSGKCDNQHQYKAILGVSMVSTPGGLTKNSPLYMGMSRTLDNLIARKLLSQFFRTIVCNKKN